LKALLQHADLIKDCYFREYSLYACPTLTKHYPIDAQQVMDSLVFLYQQDLLAFAYFDHLILWEQSQCQFIGYLKTL